MTAAYLLTADAADVPQGDDWLSPREHHAVSCFSFARRRSDWRAGRWAAKRALAASRAIAHLADTDLAILGAEDGAPEVWAAGAPVAVALSISHRDGMAAALVCRAASSAGCDVELIEPRSEAFGRDWLTSREQSMVEQASGSLRDLLVTLIWSAKESVLKATRRGLSVDTQSVDIEPSLARAGSNDWSPFIAHFEETRMTGWWKQEGRHVLTALTEPAADPPVLIHKEKL